MPESVQNQRDSSCYRAVDPFEGNVIDYLTAIARDSPERAALIERDAHNQPRCVSFGELETRADRLGHGLGDAGFGVGDHAVVMLPMCADMYAVLMAILKVGGSAVFVDPWIGPRQIARFAAYTDPVAFIGMPKSHFVRLLDGSLRGIPVSITTGSRICMFPAEQTLEELQRFRGPLQTKRTAPGDTALIAFTSGSSGMPKGANRTHELLASQHRALTATLPFRDDDVDMPTFPVFALNNVANGITTVVPDVEIGSISSIDPIAVLEQMNRHGVTTATASPPFFDQLAKQLDDGFTPRPGLRRIVTGGAPVSDSQLQYWRREFPDAEIIVLYGSTEAEPVAHIRGERRLALQSPKDWKFPGFCTGEFVEGLDARLIEIRDEPIPSVDSWDGVEVSSGEIGELIVAGEHVCKGYFQNPDAEAANKIEGPDGRIWHRMGDTGYLDDGGRFWLCGRVHSTIHRGDARIHPQLVEPVVEATHDQIERAAAVGLPDPELGERVAIAVEGPKNRDIVEAVRQKLRSEDIPFDVVEITEISLPTDPRHESKIDYSALKQRLAETELDWHS